VATGVYCPSVAVYVRFNVASNVRTVPALAGDVNASLVNSAALDGVRVVLTPGDYVSLSWFELGGTPVTICVWFYLESVTHLANLFSFGTGDPAAGGNYVYAALLAGNSQGLRVGHGTYASPLRNETAVSAAGVLTLGEWTHLAVTIEEDGALLLYVIGALRGAQTSDVKPLPYANRTTAYLGRSQYKTDGLFNGSIGDVAVYYEALSSATIASLAVPIGYQAVGCSAAPENLQHCNLHEGVIGGILLRWVRYPP
jgi:hypothetical protein